MKIDVIRLVESFSKAIDGAIIENFDDLTINNKKLRYPNLHQFKIAHFCVHLGLEIGLNKLEIEDLFILGLFHDVGFVSLEVASFDDESSVLSDYESLVNHCLRGNKLVQFLKFNTDVDNVITFHHERWDGQGFFKIKGDKIPLFSRILAIADIIDFFYNIEDLNVKYKSIVEFIKNKSGSIVDPGLVEPALKVFEEHLYSDFTKRCDEIPMQEKEYTWDEIIDITTAFMKIIDSKSEYTFKHSNTITRFVDLLSDKYLFSEDRKSKLHIAANLHDIGKLYLPISVLEKPTFLSDTEFEKVKLHPDKGYYMLIDIEEFKDIALWIRQHHEKLNGTGYPLGLKESEIAFESQMLTVCDIYTALKESRPYRKDLTDEETFVIMKKMVDKNDINPKIFTDLLSVIQLESAA